MVELYCSQAILRDEFGLLLYSIKTLVFNELEGGLDLQLLLLAPSWPPLDKSFRYTDPCYHLALCCRAQSTARDNMSASDL